MEKPFITTRAVVGSAVICTGLAIGAMGFGAGTASAMPPRPGPGAPGLCLPLLPCGGPAVPPPMPPGPGMGFGDPNILGIPFLPLV